MHQSDFSVCCEIHVHSVRIGNEFSRALGSLIWCVHHFKIVYDHPLLSFLKFSLSQICMSHPMHVSVCLPSIIVYGHTQNGVTFFVYDHTYRGHFIAWPSSFMYGILFYVCYFFVYDHTPFCMVIHLSVWPFIAWPSSFMYGILFYVCYFLCMTIHLSV